MMSAGPCQSSVLLSAVSGQAFVAQTAEEVEANKGTQLIASKPFRLEKSVSVSPINQAIHCNADPGLRLTCTTFSWLIISPVSSNLISSPSFPLRVVLIVLPRGYFFKLQILLAEF